MSALKGILRHRPLLISAVVCILLLVAVFAATRLHHNRSLHYDIREVVLNGKTANSKYRMQVADTDAKRELGLSNRDSLAAQAGMIFTYHQPQQLCFWMKDMRFAIDMVWLGKDRRVVAIAPSIPASSYPKTFCHQAQYVLEFNAGVAHKEQLQVGAQLAF